MAKKASKLDQAKRPATRNELLQIISVCDRENRFDRVFDREARLAREELEAFEGSCQKLQELRAAVKKYERMQHNAYASRRREIADLRKLILLEGSTSRVLTAVAKLIKG